MKPEDFKRLAAAGMSTDQIALVMEMMERDAKAYADAEEARKAKGRERMAKWRLERHRNVTVQSPNVREPLTRAVEDKPLPTDIEPLEDKNSTPASPSPRQHLETVLTTEQAEAVLQHRKSIKAPLTQRSAKLLARELAKCPDPNAAADTMMLRGWRGFEASWLVNPPRGSPPTSKPNPALAAADALMEKFDAVSPSQTEANPPYPRLVAVAGGG